MDVAVIFHSSHCSFCLFVFFRNSNHARNNDKELFYRRAEVEELLHHQMDGTILIMLETIKA
eukprot:7940074-Ditylum_brightwellii.AAC.1